MRDYIATKRNQDGIEKRFHIEAGNIREAAAKAEASIDNLWKIVRIEVLE